MSVARRARRVPSLIDGAAFVLVVAVLGAQSLAAGDRLDGAGPRFDTGAIVLLAAGVAMAATARRRPVVGALGALAVMVVWHRLGHLGGAVHLPFLFAFYFLGASGDRSRQLVVTGITVATTTTAMSLSGEDVAAVATAVGCTITAVVLGELGFNRRALLAEYEQRAVRAEAERELEAERRVAGVRDEIARDLHDVLAHTVSIMSVQAAVAQDALVRGSGGADAALRSIRAAGADARSEIEALVSVTRSPGGPGRLAPAPRLADLTDLARSAGALGLDVSTAVEVPEGVLSDAGQLTVYRIVQESLTNVARHARSPAAAVEVGCDGSAVHVEVRDRGDGAQRRWEPGSGLTGMRQRVESLGGRFVAGPAADGGWRVRASLPVESTCRS